MKSHLALVTGASRGIGAAVAETLGSRGIAVLCAARRAASAQETVDRIQSAGGRAMALSLDVSDPASVESALQTARDNFCEGAPITWLVNNAGVAISAPLLRSSAEGIDDLWKHHMEINFHGARRLVEALAPEMIETGYGRILNIASSAALRGYAYVAAYVASKHALLGYTRSAAEELAKKNVGVHAICPHYVDSPMTDVSIERIAEKTGQSLEEARAFFASQNPSGKLVTPQQIANCAYDLMAAESARGQILELDGGEEPQLLS
ncbi:MAG: SDR family oxidoreductase [Planctomycetota bacterium]